MLRAILFDFDYTLVDSSDGVVECVEWTLNKMKLDIPHRRAILKTIGLSLHDTFTVLTNMTDHEKKRQFSSLFLERADQVMVDRTVVFEGVADTMKYLFESGITLGIVSTKVRYRIVEILERNMLSSFFSIIVGGENVTRPKPDPEGITTALANLNISKAECIYVGDSIADAQAAKRADVEFVAVLSGVTKQAEFVLYKPLRTYNHVKDLPLLFE